MELFYVAIVIIVAGVLLALANKHIDMEGNTKKLLNGVVIVGLLLWVLKVFGAFEYVKTVHIP